MVIEAWNQQRECDPYLKGVLVDVRGSDFSNVYVLKRGGKYSPPSYKREVPMPREI